MATNNSCNLPLVAPVSRGGTGAATLTSHGILLGNGTSAITATAELSDGQLLIGSTGNAPSAATLTAGANVTITEGAGTITIAADSGPSFVWEAITADQTAAPNEGYITNGAGPITVTLPADGSSSVGDSFAIMTGTQQWVLAQLASEAIRMGSSLTTTGTGGSISSSASGDVLYVTKIASNLWQVTSSMGNPTIV